MKSDEPLSSGPPRKETAGSRYEFLSTDRNIYLTLGRDSALLTLPQLAPRVGEQGRKAGRKLDKPWQSLGARGVNNLAAKLLLALFPPNEPFFQLLIGDAEIAELRGDVKKRAEIENALASQTRTAQRTLEGSSFRPSMFEALKHLIVNGNVLIKPNADASVRVYHLAQFVSKRDCEGNQLEIITREVLHRSTIPADVRESLSRSESGKRKLASDNNEEINLYTWIKRTSNGSQWEYHQEVEDIVVDGTDGTAPSDLLPWVALRFIRVDGEDYGHGFVEEQYGDLLSFDILSRALVEGSVQSARVVWLVNPNGATNKKEISEADNGAVVAGRPDDVAALQLQKFADFRVAQEKADRLERNLSFAFLLNTAVQRQAERVTAEEIRAMIDELEESLGGIYSLLSQELQLPLARLVMHNLQKRGKVAKLPEGSVEPAILTGVQAIGRTHDLNKLQRFVADVKLIGETFPEIYDHLKVGELLERLLGAHGIEKAGLVPTEEEIAQAQQAKQQSALAAETAPDVIKQGAKSFLEANPPQMSAPPGA